MEKLNNLSSKLANKNSLNPTFDIILAITIAKIIYDIVKCWLNSKASKEEMYKMFVEGTSNNNVSVFNKIKLRVIARRHGLDKYTQFLSALGKEGISREEFFEILYEIESN